MKPMPALPQKILIIRLSSIGDIVLSTPVVRCLRKAFPKAKIDYVVKQEFLGLVKSNPHLNHVHTFAKSSGYRGLSAIKKKIQETGYDIIVDIHKNYRSRYLRFGSGAKKIAVYRKRLFVRALLVLFKLNLYGSPKPVYLRYFEAVEGLGVRYDGKGTEVVVPQREAIHIEQLLKSEGYSASRPLLVLCPGASSFNKRWPSERFVAVGRHFLHSKAYRVALLGGAEERQICESIRKGISSDVTNFAGRLKLVQSAALLGGASIVLTNDSGMMHLAQSQKRAVVALFGPTTKELGFFPMEEKSRVVEVKLRCRPCTTKGLRRCPKKHFQCMRNISSEQVISALESLCPER